MSARLLVLAALGLVGCRPRATPTPAGNGGWRFDHATCEPPSWPTGTGERLHRVGIFVACELPMTGRREDLGHVTLTIAGNGKHGAGGGFGGAELR